ncbi:MAG: hypothetical protein RIS54_1113 [Verrucomicrobiota bacterium]|jgi:nicotinamidase-related amidase
MYPVKLRTHYYQQFDADYARDVPGEGYGGWKTGEVELSPQHTALVVMHAWDCGGLDEYPGWRRAVEYYPRAVQIARDVFPPILDAVRASTMPVFHVVGWHDYYKQMPGYQKTLEIAGASPEFPQVAADAVYEKLQRFREQHVFVGDRNRPDVEEGRQHIKFLPAAQPREDEPIAEDSHQLAALCRAHGINHLVYIGFAINWCLLMSPGGMVELSRYGVICSTIREAVTAVENKETAREEREKQQALWRTSINSGFVFDAEGFIAAAKAMPRRG